jgi:hypothetical protein
MYLAMQDPELNPSIIKKKRKKGYRGKRNTYALMVGM